MQGTPAVKGRTGSFKLKSKLACRLSEDPHLGPESQARRSCGILTASRFRSISLPDPARPVMELRVTAATTETLFRSTAIMLQVRNTRLGFLQSLRPLPRM
jgi:hypothetical protein